MYNVRTDTHHDSGTLGLILGIFWDSIEFRSTDVI